MVCFIDQHRDEYGVEPICELLPIAPATYYEQKAREAQPERAPERVRRDVEISQEIQRVWDENFPALRRPQGMATTLPGGRRRRPL